MATPYLTIYTYFLAMVNDFNFANLDDTTLTAILRQYLQSAIVKFKGCRQDLTQRDDENATFLITLSDDEVQILAMLMVDAWYEIRVNDDLGLKQVLTDGDFQIHSQANHTQTNMQARQANWARVQKLINQYRLEDAFTTNSTNTILSTNKRQGWGWQNPYEEAVSPQDVIDEIFYGH